MTQIMDAVTILDRRVPKDAELQEMIAEEKRKLAIAQLVYDARIGAGLTQKQLAEKIGTRQPVVARLENAEYGSQSLAMLHRIAKALGKTLQIGFVDNETTQIEAPVTNHFGKRFAVSTFCGSGEVVI